MTYYMGIDGGGSNLRVVIVTEQLSETTRVKAGACNPSSVGRDAAADIIQQAMQVAITQAKLTPEQIAGVGIGVAGASATYAADWLRQVVCGVLPDAHIAPSSDNEIALVGARGERRGILLLSGTGSVAFGVNDAGEAVQVGGWGYLLGDEGSGYWLGLQALRALVTQSDGTLELVTILAQRVAEHLSLQSAQDVLAWVYRHDAPRTTDIARLAPIVLAEAEKGDLHAQHIITEAADHLEKLARTTMRRLAFGDAALAFAGGLLTSDNLLSRTLCQRLSLDALPVAKYEPVVGAALLAKITHRT
jgi:glucosamine kinase